MWKLSQPLLIYLMNQIKETGPSKEQTSQLMCALLKSVYTAKSQDSRPGREKPVRNDRIISTGQFILSQWFSEPQRKQWKNVLMTMPKIL